jgi:hypothetical protein
VAATPDRRGRHLLLLLLVVVVVLLLLVVRVLLMRPQQSLHLPAPYLLKVAANRSSSNRCV